jgi:RNA polymerase-binding transcription factor DksA
MTKGDNMIEKIKWTDEADVHESGINMKVNDARLIAILENQKNIISGLNDMSERMERIEKEDDTVYICEFCGDEIDIDEQEIKP